MPYTPTTWVNDSTPLDATNMNKIEQGIEAAAASAEQAPRADAITSITAWDVPVWDGSAWVRPSGTATAAKFLRGDGSWALPVSAATALPGSPADGQEAILVDSTTAPTYQWRFRYNAGNASTYKWEFIGGIPALKNAAATSDVPNSGGYIYADDTLPDFAVPRAGEYRIVATASLLPTATGYMYMGPHNASIGGGVFGSARIYAVGGYWVAATVQVTGTMAIAGQTIRLVFQAPTAGQVADRSMSVVPVRVS